MAIAVIQHALLVAHAVHLGFPFNTKVKCVSGLNGYAIWDDFIRKNVEWVNETAFLSDVHVKITESAQLVGELKNPWELRCQKFLEGSAEYNAFNPLPGEISTHVNRQAIQVAVSNASFKYKVDFDTDEDGVVVTHNSLAVAIYDKAEDTSISYISELEVAQLWTTKVEHLDVVEGSFTRVPVLFKRAYADDPAIEESYPWIKVGVLNMTEWEEWKLHNLTPEPTLDDIELDARAIDGSLGQAPIVSSTLKTNLGFDHPITSITKESIALPQVDAADPLGLSWGHVRVEPESFASNSTPANIATKLKSAASVSYPESDSTGVSGDVND